ncbi:hypothetical protein [Methylobacterium sp. WL6]|uniref:hypothetical protein n=1 Tax=Methylobacterium sp. WL6 TaxID=2603901 RepID=UPI0011CA1896|nr:hypothetical protein [Methylobacterium sp. WL6]TXN73439.1 hypothetical protein FV230_01325 [Methylobacterium sp. WL6]
MAWYRSQYECEDCGCTWENEWSCCCNDERGECGEALIFSDRAGAEAYLAVNAEAIAATREAKEDDLWG